MAEKEKWVTVNGRHVQVKDGKLALNNKKSNTKTTKKEGYKSKIDESNKFKQKEVKAKKK